MKLEHDEVKGAIARLKRANGQLQAVIRMLEEGEDCERIVTQLAAASKAIDRAGYTLITTGMKQCLATGNTDEAFTKLEKMFLSLS